MCLSKIFQMILLNLFKSIHPLLLTWKNLLSKRIISIELKHFPVNLTDKNPMIIFNNLAYTLIYYIYQSQD